MKQQQQSSKTIAIPERELWSLVRSILEQGRDIQVDYANGVYSSYEHCSARVDEAARERADKLLQKYGTADEPAARKPIEDDGHDFRSGVFTNAGYTGTACGYIVRDGTWWVATFRNEQEADSYVKWRNETRPIVLCPAGPPTAQPAEPTVLRADLGNCGEPGSFEKRMETFERVAPSGFARPITIEDIAYASDHWVDGPDSLANCMARNIKILVAHIRSLGKTQSGPAQAAAAAGAESTAALANVPYPEFCLTPKECAGRTSCRRNPSCCE